MEEDEEQTSLNSIVHIRACELFPKKPLHLDEAGLCVPFPPLHGEVVEYLGRATEGTVALSNYRLFVLAHENFFNIPLGLIESIESRDIFFLYVYCKDARTLRFTFSTNENCLEWYRRLSTATAAPKRLEDIFAFAFYAWYCEEVKDEVHQPFASGEFPRFGQSLPEVAKVTDRSVAEGGARNSFASEVERMGFDLRYAWRVSKINQDYNLIASYPRELLVPSCVVDDDLREVSEFRSSKRIPVVVWRHQRYGSIIARSSQPMVGWFGCRKLHDEKLVHAIAAACASDCGPSTPSYASSSLSSSSSSSSSTCSSQDTPPHTDLTADTREEELVRKHALQKLLIIDARSYAAAVANRAKGGGCECPEYYPNCEIQFMSLANIHSIRRSFQSVRLLCAMDIELSNWLSVLEGTKWLHHMSGLLKAAMTVVKAVDGDRRPVLVHCSDGWDRTPQIVALAELVLDPHYRTVDGFQTLVEKEWLEFGHKFGDRCGHGPQAEDANERCPVFLQWLDCVYQVLRQAPCSFEFNENFLVKLAQHAYSGLFGTFLCNSGSERRSQRVSERTCSVWTFLRSQQHRYRNVVYAPKVRVLRPQCQVRDLTFWSTVYLQGFDSADEPLAPSEDDPDSRCPSEGPAVKVLDSKLPPCATMPKTRSCDDLPSLGAESLHGRHRRCSDPNVADCQPRPFLPEDPFSGGPLSSDTKREDGRRDLPLPLHDLRPQPPPALSACESSTDTLVGDLAPEVRALSVIRATEAGVGADEGVELGEEAAVESVGWRGNLEGLTTVSTSTSDLSDSRIRGVNAPAAQGLPKCPLCTNGNRKLLEAKLRQLAAQGASRVVATPAHSRTPSSGFPATPNDDRISDCAGACVAKTPGVAMLRRKLDLDGFALPRDEVQQRLVEIAAEQQAKVNALQRRLGVAHAALCQQICQRCCTSVQQHPEHNDEAVSCSDSVGSGGEHASLGQESTSASDVSWEQVEERDTRPTLWVPDHAVLRCTGCGTKFWLGRRKHHCRKCGRIFCAHCSSREVAVPSEQFYDPVRVCASCYDQLLLCERQAAVFDSGLPSTDER